MAHPSMTENRVTEQPHARQEEVDIEALIQQLEQEPTSRKKLAKLLSEEHSSGMPLKMTYAEFLEWADEDTLAEWVNGEVIMSSPAFLPHQDIVSFLSELLRTFAFFHDRGRVIQAPFQMKLEQGREPDVLFVSKSHLSRLKETYLEGPADLVIEVISPESIGRDRGEKFYEYERGAVPEYWLIDPLTQRAEFYQLQAETGQYALIPIEADRRYCSAVLPGFWLQVDWLWQNPLPYPVQVLGEIAGVDPHEIQRFLHMLSGE